MAFFYLSINHISRSSGRSAVRSIASITGTCLVDERTKTTIDKTKLSANTFWETLSLEGSEIAKDDLSIWNKIENFEDDYAAKRYKNLETQAKYKNTARIAHTYRFALPKELTREQHIDLIREIVKDRFISIGLVATFAVLSKKGNPLAYIQVSHRAIENNQSFSKFKVTRALVSPNGIRETCKFFADKTNAFFEFSGMTERVDHRSYANRGIDLIPTKHRGGQVNKLDKLGKKSRISKQNEEIFEENKKRIIKNPNIIIQELSSNHSILCEKDIISLVKKRLGEDSGGLFETVLSSILQQLTQIGEHPVKGKKYALNMPSKQNFLSKLFHIGKSGLASNKIKGE